MHNLRYAAHALLILMGVWLMRDTFARRMVKLMGPYDIVLKHPERCGDEETAQIVFDVRVRKLARNVLAEEGTVILKNISLNDDIKIRAIMEKFTPSGWKGNYLIYDFGSAGYCTLIDTYVEEAFMDQAFRASVTDANNNTVDHYCNIPPGVYTVFHPRGTSLENYMGKSRFKFPNEFFYGEYRTKMTFYYKDFEHEVGCIYGYFEIVPKKSDVNG